MLKVKTDEAVVVGCYLISVAHEMMNGDKTFVDNHPVGVESPLNQKIGQCWNGDIGLICTLKQV